MMNLVSKLFFRISSLARKIALRLTHNDEWREVLQKWKTDNITRSLRLDYDHLDKQSVVFDLGGFKGDWASDIYAMHQCHIVIFEPCPDYAAFISNRFKNNDKISVNEFGLGAINTKMKISIAEESSSVYKQSDDMVDIQIKDINEYFQNHEYETIDLIKVNIEGGEYDLLNYLIEKGLITKFKHLQIQFHHFIPNARKEMLEIQKKLAQTHQLTYAYEFLWENWAIKN